jgi:Putative zinc-finger
MACVMDRELGAYVLHALEQDESKAVEHHLTACDECRDEVHDLAYTASLLSLLKPEDVDGLQDTTGDMGLRRRIPQRALLGVAAVVLVGSVLTPVAITVAGHVTGHRSAAPSVVRMVDPATHVKATVALTRLDVGTRLRLHLTGVPPRGWCSLVARSRDGRSDTAATWLADYGGRADVEGTTAIPADRLSELDVVTDQGQVLVSVPIADHLAPDPTDRSN